MIRVGIVAEGKSEWLVLERVMKRLKPEIEFERLRPDLTLVSGSPHGWKGVRAWCQENGPRLHALMTGVTDRPLHLVLIHVDCSMAHNVDAQRPCPPSSDTADALRLVVVQDWLGLTTLPSTLLLVTPSRETDAWVVSVLDPPYVGTVPLECDPRVEQEFVARGLLRARPNGQVKKPEGRYLPLAAGVANRLEDVCAACTQAERFCSEFQAAVALLPP